MQASEIRKELWEIAKAHQTLDGLLKKPIKPGSEVKVGTVWVDIIEKSGISIDYFEPVCTEYAYAEKPLPDPLDRLLYFIIQECKDRKAKDDDRFRSHEIQAMARRSGNEDTRCTRVERFLYSWGPFNEAIVDEIIVCYQSTSELPKWSEKFIGLRMKQMASDEWKEANRLAGDDGHRIRREMTTDCVKQAKQVD